MFKKKPQIKTLSPLRSSDRRKLADRIIQEHQLEQYVEYAEDDAAAKASATAAHTALRNAILPDNALSAKFTTTSGPDLREVIGTVYIGNHEGAEQRVLWISMHGKLYPTVYTLWKNPGILPLLHTPSVVVDKLKNGADLMTPGLAGPPFPQGVIKGSIVAVASLDKPTVPVVVGVCEIDVSTLQRTQGVKGHAVETIHWEGDEIWDWSTAGVSGTTAPEHLDGWIETNANDVTNGTRDLSLDDEEGESGGVSLPANSAQPIPREYQGTANGHEDLVEEVDEPDMTVEDIDYAFRQAFIFGIYHHLQPNPSDSKHGLNFPLTQSVIMSTLVLPFLPTFTTKQTESLVIKKTSWKNARKFIKALEKEKLVLAKDRPGNEVDILDIDFDDPKFRTFQPYRLPKKEGTGKGGGGSGTASVATSSGDDSVGQKLKRVDLYKPRDNMSRLFQSSHTDSNSTNKPTYYTASDIRTHIVSYLESQNLIPPTNKRLANLDPILANTLFNPSTSRIDAEVLAKGSIPCDALIDRVISASQPFHLILRNDEQLDLANSKGSDKPKPGAAPRVLLTLETRSGNKTVTRVSGLEAFFIAAQPLADELRKACASSTSIEPLKGAPPGKGFMEVMVQGPQGDAVVKALEKRGVNKQWVEVVDKTKGKKK